MFTRIQILTLSIVVVIIIIVVVVTSIDDVDHSLESDEDEGDKSKSRELWSWRTEICPWASSHLSLTDSLLPLCDGEYGREDGESHVSSHLVPHYVTVVGLETGEAGKNSVTTCTM